MKCKRNEWFENRGETDVRKWGKLVVPSSPLRLDLFSNAAEETEAVDFTPAIGRLLAADAPVPPRQGQTTSPHQGSQWGAFFVGLFLGLRTWSVFYIRDWSFWFSNEFKDGKY